MANLNAFLHKTLEGSLSDALKGEGAVGARLMGIHRWQAGLLVVEVVRRRIRVQLGCARRWAAINWG